MGTVRYRIRQTNAVLLDCRLDLDGFHVNVLPK
jgi:hypothetical protein